MDLIRVSKIAILAYYSILVCYLGAMIIPMYCEGNSRMCDNRMCDITPCSSKIGLLPSCSPKIGWLPPSPSLITVGGGMFNVCGVRHFAQWQLEWRPDYKVVYKIKPIAGLMVTQKWDTYIYGGFQGDFAFHIYGASFAIIPSMAAGIYTRANGKSLHYPLEFRSSMELAYVFENQSRLGIQFYHISNAHLGHNNPGEESLVINYSIPMDWLTFKKKS